MIVFVFLRKISFFEIRTGRKTEIPVRNPRDTFTFARSSAYGPDFRASRPHAARTLFVYAYERPSDARSRETVLFFLTPAVKRVGTKNTKKYKEMLSSRSNRIVRCAGRCATNWFLQSRVYTPVRINVCTYAYAFRATASARGNKYLCKCRGLSHSLASGALRYAVYDDRRPGVWSSGAYRFRTPESVGCICHTDRTYRVTASRSDFSTYA